MAKALLVNIALETGAEVLKFLNAAGLKIAVAQPFQAAAGPLPGAGRSRSKETGRYESRACV